MKAMTIGNRKIRLSFSYAKGAKYFVTQQHDINKFEESLNQTLKRLEDKGAEILDVEIYHTAPNSNASSLASGNALYHTADIWYLKK